MTFLINWQPFFSPNDYFVLYLGAVIGGEGEVVAPGDIGVGEIDGGIIAR